jgi:hypothetical protein
MHPDLPKFIISVQFIISVERLHLNNLSTGYQIADII